MKVNVAGCVRSIFILLDLNGLHQLFKVDSSILICLQLLLHLDDQIELLERSGQKQKQTQHCCLYKVQNWKDKHSQAHDGTIAHPVVFIAIVIKREIVFLRVGYCC